jgi:hypothetical protein
VAYFVIVWRFYVLGLGGIGRIWYYVKPNSFLLSLLYFYMCAIRAKVASTVLHSAVERCWHDYQACNGAEKQFIKDRDNVARHRPNCINKWSVPISGESRYCWQRN